MLLRGHRKHRRRNKEGGGAEAVPLYFAKNRHKTSIENWGRHSFVGLTLPTFNWLPTLMDKGGTSKGLLKFLHREIS